MAEKGQIMSRVTQVKTQHLAEKTNLQAVLFFVKLFRLFFYFFFSFFFILSLGLYPILTEDVN